MKYSIVVHFLIAFSMLVSSVSVLFSADSEKTLSADEIVDKVISTYRELDSYEYMNFDRGYDTFTKKQQKNIGDMYSTVAERLRTAAPEVEKEPRIVEGTHLIKFKKPYLLQMKLIKSDYVPSIVYGTVVTYRPDKNPDVWWAKVRFLPSFKRSVANDDAGGFFSKNWMLPVLNLDVYRELGTMKLNGIKSFEGVKCYILDFEFNFSGDKKIEIKKPDYRRWGVPKEIEKFINDDLLRIKEIKPSSIRYWIDAERFLILKTEQFVNKKFLDMSEYREIKLNHLSKKDF
ncbi:MAG: hypothetical protein AB1546_00920 [bacterium]